MDRALKIGIPNRSSLLHALGVAHLIAAELMPFEDYDPAKLWYSFDRAQIILTRCNELCGLFDRGAIDVMLNGGDYVAEHLTESFGQQLEFDVNAVQFVLLVDGRHDPKAPFETVFTKFPRVARRYLSEWQVSWETITPVSGGVEAFCKLEPRSAAFDVVCTGNTVRANDLRILKQSESIYPAWYARTSLPSEILDCYSNAKLTDQLKRYYRELLLGRDLVLANAIRSI